MNQRKPRQDTYDRGSDNGAASPEDTLGSTVRCFAEVIARAIAIQVVEHLRAKEFPGYIDQSASPLGRRRHIEAVRSGRLPGVRVGRRYLARAADVDALIRDGSVASIENTDVAELAAELGIELRRRSG